jgi:hypothetical protein
LTLAKNAKSNQLARTLAGLARKTSPAMFDLPPSIRSGQNRYAWN